MSRFAEYPTAVRLYTRFLPTSANLAPRERIVLHYPF